MGPEEVGTGHVSSSNADVAPLTLYCCFFVFFLRWLFLEFWTTGSRETAQLTPALAAKNCQLAKYLARKSCDFDFRFQPPLLRAVQTIDFLYTQHVMFKHTVPFITQDTSLVQSGHFVSQIRTLC